MPTYEGTLVCPGPDPPEHRPPCRRLGGIGGHATDVRFAELVIDHAFDEEEEAALVASRELNGRFGRHLEPSAPQGKPAGDPRVGENVAVVDLADFIRRKELLDSQVKAMHPPPRQGELEQLLGIRVELQVDVEYSAKRYS